MKTYPAITVSRTGGDEGFDELVAAVLDDFGVTAIDEAEAGALRAFFADADGRDRAAAAVAARFPDSRVVALDVPDENWAERSQAALKAIQAGAITVAPPWDAPAGATAETIIIQPAMGFGTGHHATTRLCLEAMQRVPMSGASVVDVGTGSGVLAIAAVRLGARRVVAFDNDQDAIDNARENVALNDVSVDLRVAAIEELQLEAATFDLVTANLTGATLTKVAGRLQSLSGPQGILLLSGILQEESDAVKAVFAGWQVVAETTENEWVCLVLRRSQA